MLAENFGFTALERTGTSVFLVLSLFNTGDMGSPVKVCVCLYFYSN